MFNPIDKFKIIIFLILYVTVRRLKKIITLQ